MLTFFIVMVILSNTVGILTCLIFLIGAGAGSRVFSDADLHGRCHQQVGTCRSASLLFSIFFWLIASCLPTAECLERYIQLSDVTRIYGYIWVIVGFCAVITSIIANIKKKAKDVAIIAAKIKRSSFFIGFVFLLSAYILNVR